MVISCSAYACSNKWSRDSPIHFHKFPFRSRSLCEKWVRALKRKDFVPTKASLVCSDHFRDDDYVERAGLTKRMLKKDAVPSIFNFPVHLGGDMSQNHVLKKRKSGNTFRRKELIDMDNIDSLIHELEVLEDNEMKRVSAEEVNCEVYLDDEEKNDSLNVSLNHDSMEICDGITNMYNIEEEDDLLEMAEADEEDQCYIMGSIWGERLKLLSEDIRSRVREIINQVFKEAQKGTLSDKIASLER
ncbi:peroxynitrite isomerase THAP4-like isoform X2 [Planococcus citri]|uniref:peroxynitrite isomerase THAP4-like isoform X2 n=1 Tax=Planococcus citri TaxID=170843 RepID=UPI0031F78C9D